MGAMSKIDFAKSLNWNLKNIGARLGALDLLLTCGRCGGSGSYSFCTSHGSTCFGCGGGGKGLPKLTAKLLKLVQEKVAAGDLEPYLAVCKAKAEARATIKPLIQAAKDLYAPIGQAYNVEYVRNHGAMDEKVFAAQTMNNALYYGNSIRGIVTADPFQMSVSEIESALKFNKISPEVAVVVILERIEQLTQLQTAFHLR